MRLLAIHYYCYAYLLFTILYRVQEEIYGRKKTAVEETIKICMNRDILSKYLEEREKEVINMMSLLYDEEVIQKNYMKEVISETQARDTKGIVELGKELGWSDEETLKRLQQILKISQEEAKKYLEMVGK